jgi:nucleoside-diphosphate-sugar epimerase
MPLEMATTHLSPGSLGSKSSAVKAAWTFCANEKLDFSAAVINPLNPLMVTGPGIHYINSLDAIDTSIIGDIIQGKVTDNHPAVLALIWLDVRDVAINHVKDIEVSEAAGKRCSLATGHFSNEEIVEVFRKIFPELEEKLPSMNGEDDFPSQIFNIGHSRRAEILGIEYRSFVNAIADTVESLRKTGV